MSSNDYVPGYSEQEARRLTVQASVIDHLTEGVLRQAGLTAGMEVLDVGSGVGDVAMLAARLVRPNGTVLGLERSAQSVAIARHRAAAAGIFNVDFVVGEIDSFVPDRQFDALTLRLVLLFLPDPAVALCRVAGFVRPGGVVAVQEVDQPTWSTVPRNDLFDKVIGWLVGTMTRSGVEPEMGCRLAEVFRRAGLPAPFMNAAQIAGCQPESPLYQFLADMIRTLLPHIVRLGLATEQEIAIGTLSERLRQEVAAHHLTVFSSRMIGAWARLPLP
jgi:ubiquinone/menaquinone biosynthesis C-methylase UbiE